MLAEIVRVDRGHVDRSRATVSWPRSVKTLARTQQTLIWTRQRQANQLRSTLREFYPAALEAFSDDLAGRDALAVLATASIPTTGRSHFRGVPLALRKGGQAAHP